jgi:hypothetical protein
VSVWQPAQDVRKRAALASGKTGVATSTGGGAVCTVWAVTAECAAGVEGNREHKHLITAMALVAVFPKRNMKIGGCWRMG